MKISSILHNQWATRKEDEAYQSLDPMWDKAKMIWDTSETMRLSAKASQVHMKDGAMYLNDFKFNSDSLDQMAAMLGVPTLPSLGRKGKLNWDFQTQVYNELLSKRGGSFVGLRLGDHWRAVNTDTFSRISGHATIKFLMEIRDGGEGWMHPTSMKEGYRGLYMGQDCRDVFVSIFNESLGIDDGRDGGVKIGVMAFNSEIGNKRALKIYVFGYSAICQNHTIFGFEEKLSARVVHKGEIAQERWIQARNAATGMAAKAQSEFARIIGLARKFSIGSTSEAAVEWLAKHDIAKKHAEAAVAYNVSQGVDPTILWNAHNGLTAITHLEGTQFADMRFKRDEAAGRILAVVR